MHITPPPPNRLPLAPLIQAPVPAVQALQSSRFHSGPCSSDAGAGVPHQPCFTCLSFLDAQLARCPSFPAVFKDALQLQIRIFSGVLPIKATFADSVETQACITPAGGLQSAGCACAGPVCGCCAQPLHAGQSLPGAWLHCLHLLPVYYHGSAAASAQPCRLAAHACRRVSR